MRRLRRIKRVDQSFDMGGGFYVERRQEGASIWWGACQLDAPGGYVVNRRLVRDLGYRRDAEAQITEWKQQDAEAAEPRECQTCGDISLTCPH